MVHVWRLIKRGAEKWKVGLVRTLSNMELNRRSSRWSDGGRKRSRSVSS